MVSPKTSCFLMLSCFVYLFISMFFFFQKCFFFLRLLSFNLLGWAELFFLDCSSPRVHHSNLGGSNLSLGTILMRFVTRPWEIMAATWRDCQNGPRRLAAVSARCRKSWDVYRLVDLTGWLTGWRWWKWRRWWSFCSELVPLHVFFCSPENHSLFGQPSLTYTFGGIHWWRKRRWSKHLIRCWKAS